MTKLALRRAAEVRWQALDINKEARARQKAAETVLPLVNLVVSGARNVCTNPITGRKAIVASADTSMFSMATTYATG